MTQQPDIELFQFAHSHFNEKARWALDWKAIPHIRTSLLPGPHVPVMRKLTGQTSTPALRIGQEFIVGSGDIVLHLNKIFPDNPLLPEDPELAEQAIGLQHKIDNGLGPALRFCAFALLKNESGYLADLMAGHKSAIARIAYRAALPLLMWKINRMMDLDNRELFEQQRAVITDTLDMIAGKVNAHGYLVGEQFTLADMAAAALAVPLARPPEAQIRWPENAPASAEEWNSRWREHDACKWVREIHTRHRGKSAATS